MWPYTLATLKQALRSPVGWVLLAIGAFIGWFAASAAILALDEVGAQSQPLTISTAQLAGVLLTLWLVGRGLDEDRHSGFAAAADSTRPGPTGRLLGRWLGATASGTILACLTALTIASSAALEDPDGLYLASTSIGGCAAVGAWAVLLGSVWRGIGATLAVFLLWVLGHLPWGVEPFLAGAAGRIVGGLLPGPYAAGTLSALGYTSAAVAGLLLVTLALSRPADA
ncbi:MAG: hypothetical protein QNJ90_15565 [Planctomycetota bacterium]|nr:hypothetical protein [Planctomycetota bacterium]